MKFWHVLLLMAGIYSGSSPGQNCDLHLSGVIYEQNAQSPLAFASIYIPELKKGVISDSLGKFEIDNLCPGTYTLMCDHEHTEKLEVSHELDPAHQFLEIILQSELLELEQVEITAELDGAPTLPKVRLEGVELAQTRGQSLGQALDQLPGVSSLKTGATIVKPVIHGLHSNRVLILNNGIRQEGQQWGSEHAPEIDPFIATQITLIKGASSVRYGSGAVAGVILVEPAPLRDSSGIGGWLNLVGLSNGRQGVVSGMVEGSPSVLPAWSWRLQATLKKGGNLHTPDYFLDNTGLREQNFSAALNYRTLTKGLEVYYSQFHSKLGILAPAHVGGLSDLEAALTRSQPLGSDTVGFTYAIRRPYQQISHHLTKVSGYQRLADGGKLTATYAFQYNHRREFDKHQPRGTNPDGKDRAELDFQIFTHTMESVWEHKPVRDFHGSLGVSGLYQNNQLNGRPFIPNFVAAGGEIFAIEAWQREKWEIEGGIRYDYRWIHSAREVQGQDIYTIQHFQNFSGTLGAHYRFSPFLRLNSHLGTAWRPPHVNELFSDGLHHGAGAIERGDSTLSPEQGIKWISTLTVNQFKGLNASLSVYYHHFSNFIYKRPGGIEKTIRGAFPLFQYAETQARLMGGDVNLRYEFPFGLSWEGKAAFLDAKNITDNEPLIFMPPNEFEQKLGFHFKDGIMWTDSYVRVGLKKVFEQKNVPISENPIERDWLPPPAAYELINIEAGTTLSTGKQHVELGMGVENLFNVAYRDYLNSFRYYADEMGRNVSVRVKYIF